MKLMKSWSVYLPNGEAVVVVGEIECRDGKFYFTNGEDVVAVFNEDKVCGVSKDYEYSQYVRGQYPQGKED